MELVLWNDTENISKTLVSYRISQRSYGDDPVIMVKETTGLEADL